MEKIITIILNIVLFLLLVFNVNDYADMVLGIESLILIGLFIFYLIYYRGKYIDKKIIYIHILNLLLQILLIVVLENLNIWKVSSGYMGLGGGPFGMLFYFILLILFIILILVTNIFKYLIHMIKHIK